MSQDQTKIKHSALDLRDPENCRADPDRAAEVINELIAKNRVLDHRLQAARSIEHNVQSAREREYQRRARLEATCAQLSERLTTAVRTLEFYAAPDNWREIPVAQLLEENPEEHPTTRIRTSGIDKQARPGCALSLIDQDLNGRKAREALSAISGKPDGEGA